MLNVTELLRQHEGKTLEFKRDLSSPDGVMRTLVAFANGAGGVLLVGDGHTCWLWRSFPVQAGRIT